MLRWGATLADPAAVTEELRVCALAATRKRLNYSAWRHRKYARWPSRVRERGESEDISEPNRRDESVSPEIKNSHKRAFVRVLTKEVAE